MTTTTTTTIITIAELRRRYSKAVFGLAYYNADKATATAAIAAAAAKLAKGATPTPAQWVRAAESAELPCRRCACTGRFTTGVHNGKPTGPGGPCYRCGGRGYQTAADGLRNYGADGHAITRACSQMFAECDRLSAG